MRVGTGRPVFVWGVCVCAEGTAGLPPESVYPSPRSELQAHAYVKIHRWNQYDFTVHCRQGKQTNECDGKRGGGWRAERPGWGVLTHSLKHTSPLASLDTSHLPAPLYKSTDLTGQTLTRDIIGSSPELDTLTGCKWHLLNVNNP